MSSTKCTHRITHLNYEKKITKQSHTISSKRLIWSCAGWHPQLFLATCGLLRLFLLSLLGWPLSQSVCTSTTLAFATPCSYPTTMLLLEHFQNHYGMASVLQLSPSVPTSMTHVICVAQFQDNRKHRREHGRETTDRTKFLSTYMILPVLSSAPLHEDQQ